MGVKLAKTLFLLLFAIPFGGVGVFAGWVITGMVQESQAAKDWVVVAAKVEEAKLDSHRGSKGGITYTAIGSYRYEYGGKTYVGTQLGLERHGFAEQGGDWQHEMVDYLTDAKDKGKTISVYVDPDNPGHALVDREMRWGSVVMLIVFGGLFGAIGFGLLIPIVGTWFEPDPAQAKQGKSRPGAKGGRSAHTAKAAKSVDRSLGGPLLKKVAVVVAILVAIWIAYDSYTLFAASP